MTKLNPLMVAPPLVFAAFALMFYFGLGKDDNHPSARQGGPAPALFLSPVGPEPTFGDAELREPGVKLVNVWASWCTPCRAEHPNLVMLAEEGLPIYGINRDTDVDKALGFLEELGNPYTALGMDQGARTAIEWGATGVPETFIIDSEGIVVLRFAGPITQRVLESTVRPAIEAAK